MQIKFLPNKTLNLTYNCPPIGYFACFHEATKPIIWDHCREQFLGKMSTNMIGFYFSHHDQKADHVACFINKFEKVLKMSCDNFIYSNYRKTEKENIIWIEPSLFWLDCLFKRSLLTLLLRCSLNFDIIKNNFDDCLFGQFPECKLAKDTKNALIRFMFGFTTYKGMLPHFCANANSTLIRHGWHSEFANADVSTVKNKLVLSQSSNIKSNFGFNFLWN